MHVLKGEVDGNGVLQARFLDENGSEHQGPVAIHAADKPGNVLRIGFASTGDVNKPNRTMGVAICRATANRPERVILLDNWGKPAFVMTDGEGVEPDVKRFAELSSEVQAEIELQLNGEQE